MQAYNLLSQEERGLIKEYINTYGGVEGSGTYVVEPMEHILRFWDKNKEFLCTLFGEQLILEKEIDIKRPLSILMEDMEKVLYNYDEPLEFVQKFENFIYDNFRDRDYTFQSDLRHLMDLEVLVNNVYDFPTFEIPVPNGHPIQVQNGAKAMKMLSKIAKAFNLPGFEEFRVAHSMVLNQKRFKGILCLSIHPLDYMTMSDNDCNWESCMSWQGDGEYRLGTVEMMNSPYIIVAYLKAEKDFDIFGDKSTMWNNKRWRELFVVSPEMLFAIKGYPYTEDTLRKSVFEWLLELMEINHPECDFSPEEFKVKNHTPVNIKGVNFNIDLGFHAMYNDIAGSHPAYFSSQIFNLESKSLRLMLSGQTECMICGDDWTNDYHDWDTELLICPECSGVKKCPECCEYVGPDDMVELGDGTTMCRWCAEHYTASCDYCEDIYNENSITQVHARHMGRMESHTINLCCDCYNCDGVKQMIGPITYERRGTWSMYKVPQADTTNFTTEGYQLFGYLDDEIEDMKIENIKGKLRG